MHIAVPLVQAANPIFLFIGFSFAKIGLLLMLCENARG